MDLIPSKEELKKKLESFNKRLKLLEEHMLTIPNHDEEDAMMTKKKIGPLNCASCDKNIVNLSNV